MMSKTKILLIGAGGHAQACIDVIEQHEQFSIAGLIGMPEEMNSQLHGYPIIGTDEDLSQLAKTYQHALIVTGQIESPENRIRLFQRVTDLGFEQPVIIAADAYVSRHATIGPGTIVMHGAIVNAGAKVGCNCIVNTRALLEHGAVIEDHCHISTGAIVNGHVNIGTGCFIGSGSGIRESVVIAERCVIGMGQQITKNCAPGTIMPVQQASV